MHSDQLTVERAAIKSADGVVHDVPRPGRHHNVIAKMIDLGYPAPISGQQGFVLSDGSFADRFRAKQVAVAASQLLPRASKRPELYSECVW